MVLLIKIRKIQINIVLMFFSPLDKQALGYWTMIRYITREVNQDLIYQNDIINKKNKNES